MSFQAKQLVRFINGKGNANTDFCNSHAGYIAAFLFQIPTDILAHGILRNAGTGFELGKIAVKMIIRPLDFSGTSLCVKLYGGLLYSFLLQFYHIYDRIMIESG